MLAPRRLPGLRIAAAAPPALEALPRMDVAVFAGFASTGPVQVPVAIESVTQYADVFSSDAPLAWDAERGERVFAYLGPAVRAFFANGGRRCWVIRVARTHATESLRRSRGATAIANQFAIPGVLQIERDGNEVKPAIAAARCEGSWSDPLRVSSALAKLRFTVGTLTPIASPAPASPAGERYRLGSRVRLRSGDLLELGDPNDVSAYAIVDSVRATRADTDDSYTAEITVCAAFERLSPASSPAMGSPALPGEALVPGFDAVFSAALGSAGSDSTLRLTFAEPMPPTLAASVWVRWSGASETVWLRMDSIARSLTTAIASPAAGRASWIDASADGPAWRELGRRLPMPVDSITQASVLSLDLRVARALADEFRLSGIGLTPQHPASWWQQTADAEYFAPRDEGAAVASALEMTTSGPRFPLAAQAAAALAWIPLGVEPLFTASVGPLPEPGTPLERDGLAHFDPEMFLDPELASSSVATLLEYADHIRYRQEPPRELFGVHGALWIGRGGLFNEASLLALPDAVHLGWRRRDVPDADEPEPAPPSVPAHWRGHRGPCAQAASPHDGAFEPDFGVFLDCGTHSLEAPTLSGAERPVSVEGYRLTWSDSAPGATYVLRESQRPDFGEAREVQRGLGLEYVVEAQREGIYYYQVTAESRSEVSAGSNPVAVVVRADEWVALPAAEFSASKEAALLRMQRSVLRLAAASGELFAVFALPRHFRTPEAVRHAQRLRAVRSLDAVDPEAFGVAEARALSYGALYHPWVASGTRATSPATPASGNKLRVVPPDGPATGVLAARASARGAWIAPANEPFQDIVALTPAIQGTDWQALQDAQVNLVRGEARGFLTLSADTLANEAELLPISVRRLLILLRRLALRRGTSFVFEPNGAQLRRAVQGSFSLLLGDLFRRGAFAGDTAAQSFRVVTDDTINTPRDADAGRFIVELRVAPSVPMRFLSVLLAQSGGRLSVVEEL